MKKGQFKKIDLDNVETETHWVSDRGEKVMIIYPKREIKEGEYFNVIYYPRGYRKPGKLRYFN
tara:strand:- start:4344 stop:4532 length:189 start_codon:yes stop_codon:yes gene_type:complete